MKFAALAVVLVSCSASFAKGRAPAQFPGSTPVASTGTFNAEDVIAAAGQVFVTSVRCIGTNASTYSIDASGTDVRIARVASGGAISYEVYKGSRFLGACPSVHVLSR